MKHLQWLWKSTWKSAPVLLALGLLAGPWVARQAASGAATATVAGAISRESAGAPAPTFAAATPQPTAQSSPPEEDGGQPGSWLLFMLAMFCGMAVLLLAGIGAAPLLLRIRERFR